MADMERVIVVGAGVVGLSCAVRLLEAGHRVDVIARELPLETTSAVAAAIWYPYLAYPREQVQAWSLASLAVFEELAADPATGVVPRWGVELLRERAPRPQWAAGVPSSGPPSGCRPATRAAGACGCPSSRCRSTWRGSPRACAPSAAP